MVAPDRDKLRRSFRVPKAPSAEATESRIQHDEAVQPEPSAHANEAGGMLAYLQRRRSGFSAAPQRPVVALPEGREEVTAYGQTHRGTFRSLSALLSPVFSQGNLVLYRVLLGPGLVAAPGRGVSGAMGEPCLLYTSDAADE